MTAKSQAPAPELDAQALSAAGRTPCVPFSIRLDNGTTVEVVRLLRVLPGKRIVGEGRTGGKHVLIKLFVARESKRHWLREHDGIAALETAGILTPPQEDTGMFAGGGHALLTTFLPDAKSLTDLWQEVSAHNHCSAASIAILRPVLNALGRMHAAGLTQEDLHLGNFLLSNEQLFVIDGDAIRVNTQRCPLPFAEATRNLAILLAQLPTECDAHIETLLGHYHGDRPTLALHSGQLLQEVARVRARRLNSFLAKTVRDCTHFAVQESTWRFTAISRDDVPALATLTTDPDRALANGKNLKDGRTASVAQVIQCGRPLVIKRYNLKGPGHAFSRLWRVSRAWHSWREAHRLSFLGIPTPRPLALVEERVGPLRRRAWLVTDYCPGQHLLAHLAVERIPPTAEGKAIIALFTTLDRERITHGDLKATNLLWHENRIFLIDLDAMVQHRNHEAHARAWRKDRARLLRNWPQDSALVTWLDANLPPAP